MTDINRKDNPQLAKLISDLKAMSREQKAPIWRAVAVKLERPDRSWSEVNVSRIARFAKEGELLVVPGKLLGSGIITFGVTVAAFRASAQARKKIEAAGGRAVTIRELASANPSGAGIRIMG
jgi:large subunit ribosomal protein L18e